MPPVRSKPAARLSEQVSGGLSRSGQSAECPDPYPLFDFCELHKRAFM